MDNLIINVNSNFADKTKYTSSNFVYHLDEEIKNIAYMKLGSVEFPSSTYNFLLSKANTSFKIGDGSVEDTVTIADGNYTTDTLTIAIQDKFDLINSARSKNYEVDVDINTGKIFFTSDDSFRIDFSNTDVGYGSLGFHMGFNDNIYTNDSRIEGDNVVKLNNMLYYFLKINDIDNVQDYYVKNGFAKIIQTTGSFDFTIQGKGDFVAKEKVFRSPINISKLNVQLVDYRDRIIDLNGLDFSFTLEIGYVYDKKLYEELNNNGIPNGDHRTKYFY